MSSKETNYLSVAPLRVPPIRVAIDGPSGVGKSTISRLLAKKHNLTYIDTGAMYRATALYLDTNKIDLKSEESLVSALNDMKISFGNSGTITILNGEDVSLKIRTKEITHLSSIYSTEPAIREHMLGLQQAFAKTGRVIMEGRDIGTRIMTDAEVKIFLVATTEIRAKRRFLELEAKNMLQSQDIESIKKNIEDRDLSDSTRDHSPLLKAQDAVEIDTDKLTIEEVVQEISRLIEDKQ